MDSQKPEPNISELSPDDLEAKLAAITAERDKLEAEKAELQDKYLRSQAEFINARNRAERERTDYLQFAAMDLVRNILPVLDDFERALKVESQDKEYERGIALIYQRMYDTLKKMGLEPIEAVGKRFDPNHHEAVQLEQIQEGEDQQVLEELQRGYNFRGKLLRPSWVKVAVKS